MAALFDGCVDVALVLSQHPVLRADEIAFEQPGAMAVAHGRVGLRLGQPGGDDHEPCHRLHGGAHGVPDQSQRVGQAGRPATVSARDRCGAQRVDAAEPPGHGIAEDDKILRTQVGSHGGEIASGVGEPDHTQAVQPDDGARLQGAVPDALRPTDAVVGRRGGRLASAGTGPARSGDRAPGRARCPPDGGTTGRPEPGEGRCATCEGASRTSLGCPWRHPQRASREWPVRHVCGMSKVRCRPPEPGRSCREAAHTRDELGPVAQHRR